MWMSGFSGGQRESAAPVPDASEAGAACAGSETTYHGRCAKSLEGAGMNRSLNMLDLQPKKMKKNVLAPPPERTELPQSQVFNKEAMKRLFAAVQGAGLMGRMPKAGMPRFPGM